MTPFILIILMSIWSIYQYLGYFGILQIPYISLFTGKHFLITAMKMMTMKWSLIFGIIGVFLGIAGIIQSRLDEERGLEKMKMPAFVFYIIFTVLLLL